MRNDSVKLPFSEKSPKKIDIVTCDGCQVSLVAIIILIL